MGVNKRSENLAATGFMTMSPGEEEQKFSSGDRNMVVYLERKEQGVKEKNEHKRVNKFGTQQLTAGVTCTCCMKNLRIDAWRCAWKRVV